MVEPLRTNSKLPCKSAYPVVEGWLNHPKLTRNCPIGLLPPGSQWFSVVKPSNHLELTRNCLVGRLTHASQRFEEVRWGRTTAL